MPFASLTCTYLRISGWSRLPAPSTANQTILTNLKRPELQYGDISAIGALASRLDILRPEAVNKRWRGSLSDCPLGKAPRETRCRSCGSLLGDRNLDDLDFSLRCCHHISFTL